MSYEDAIAEVLDKVARTKLSAGLYVCQRRSIHKKGRIRLTVCGERGTVILSERV